jgi:anaerobic selenocysteine-containing dehydrogenase
MMKRMKRGGGWAAIRYTLGMANRVGWWQLWKAMRSKNACRFATPSGKAQFAVHSIPSLACSEQQLRLMTVRSEGQFNTVVYEEEDIYRGPDRRNVILMNREDIQRLGLHVDRRVTVRSATGAMSGILVREHDIRAGNALMYFPEANVLVPATTDPDSKTPAFKCVLVTLEPDGAGVASDAEQAGGHIPLELSL